MDPNRPILVASEEEVESLPVLVIDKKGFIGTPLAKKLQEQFLTVFVSSEPGEGARENIIHVPFRKHIPRIPDNNYSHIFLVYNGEQVELDMLPSLMTKANQAGARLLFVTSLSEMNKKLFAHLEKHEYNSMQVVVYGETFDDSITEANQVNFFIHQARTYGRIEVPNAGLGHTRPVLFADVLASIIETAFSPEKRKRVLLVFPHHPITEISVARMLEQCDPEIKLDFKKQKSPQPKYFIPEGEYFFHNYDLKERLKQISLARKASSTSVPQKKIKLVRGKRKRWGSAFWIAASALVFFVVLPPLLSFFFALGGAGFLGASFHSLEKGNIASARQLASFATSSFTAAEAISSGLLLLDLVAPDKKMLLTTNIQLGKEVAETELEAVRALSSLQLVFDGKSLDPQNDFLRSTATIKNALLSIQKMKAEGKLPEVAVDKLEEMRYEITLFENLLDTLPALLGFEGKRSYLVLFQNNMELRPGGGFIGSYGVLDIEKGKIGEFKIYDVYDADGQLKTHVEPPYGLRRYMGAVHWFLRDSNFEVDFTRNAANAKRFLQMEMGQSVDGIIAIDTEFLKSILSAFGSVYVADYKETVTPDNFYLLTQTHAEKNFFPGSTQKKDFLRSLGTSLLQRLSERKAEPYLELVKKTGQALREKHVLFAFSDPAVQDVFTVSKLSSSLWEGRSGGEQVFLDAFGVVDANVGANKSNYYLKRSIRQRVSVSDDGSVSETAEITYTNTSAKDSPFGGDYKNYVRLLLPRNAVVQSIAVDNKEIPLTPAITDPEIFTKKEFVPPPALELEEIVGQEKKTVGFFINVPIGSSKTVAITYANGTIGVYGSSFVYDLLTVKQPGTLADPYSLVLTYPSSFRLFKGNAEIRDLGGKVVYETLLNEDKNVRVEFTRK